MNHCDPSHTRPPDSTPILRPVTFLHFLFGQLDRESCTSHSCPKFSRYSLRRARRCITPDLTDLGFGFSEETQVLIPADSCQRWFFLTNTKIDKLHFVIIAIPPSSDCGKAATTPGFWFCRLLSTILDAYIRKSKSGGHKFESHLCSSFFLNDLAIWASIFIGFTERGRKKKHDTSSFGLSPVSSDRMLV